MHCNLQFNYLPTSLTTYQHATFSYKRKVAFAWNVFELGHCGMANFSTPDPLRNLLTDSGSKILQQHSTLKYSDTKIRFDKKFKPIVILLNNLEKRSLITSTYFDILFPKSKNSCLFNYQLSLRLRRLIKVTLRHSACIVDMR